MSDLERLLDADATGAERRLLRSARLDVAPSAGKAHLLGALGLVAAGTASAPASGAAAVFAKWIAIGAVAGAVTSGSYQAVRAFTSSNDSATGREAVTARAGRARTRTSPLGIAPSAFAPSGASHEHAPTPDESARASDVRASSKGAHAPHAGGEAPTPSARAITPNAREKAAELGDKNSGFEATSRNAAMHSQGAFPAPAEASTEPRLDVEVRSLDAARSALASNDAHGALAALDDYDRRFTAPRLAPEAALLRVELLVALGRRAEARDLGERWLARDPSGAHAERLRALLDDAGRSLGDQSKPTRP